jgi:hypothetical protein
LEQLADFGGIERGERNVSLVNIERIAKALRIPSGREERPVETAALGRTPAHVRE